MHKWLIQPTKSELQYLGLDKKKAESLTPLFSCQHFAPEQIPEKCEFRDVIPTSIMIEIPLRISSFSHSVCPGCARKFYPELYVTKEEGDGEWESQDIAEVDVLLENT
jgi:hypothetical protein